MKELNNCCLISGNPTQDEINKTIFCEEETKTFTHFRYDIVEETDAEPEEMKVLLLKTTEGKLSLCIFRIFTYISQ